MDSEGTLPAFRMDHRSYGRLFLMTPAIRIDIFPFCFLTPGWNVSSAFYTLLMWNTAYMFVFFFSTTKV